MPERLDGLVCARRGHVLTLRENRQVGDEREFRRARGLHQRRVERRQRQFAATGEFEVNGAVGREIVAGRSLDVRRGFNTCGLRRSTA